MYQPRRLSPASSSPLYRNVNPQQQNQIKLQLKQVTPTHCVPPYIQVIQQQKVKQSTYNQYENNSRQISRERESVSTNQSKDQTIQNYSESEYQSSQQLNQTIVMKEQNQICKYIDSLMKQQKQELSKVLDHQNKQIEFMQQIIITQTQQQQNLSQQLSQFQNSIDLLQNQMARQNNELSNKIQQYLKSELDNINIQLEKLRNQMFQINITNSKLISEKLQQSFQNENNYNKSIEYDKRNKIYDKSTQQSKTLKDDQIQESTFSKNYDGPLSDITNIPIKYIRSLQQSLQNSRLSKQSSSNINQKGQEGSPIELFNEQNILDSLDNIKVFDPYQQQQQDMVSDQYSQARMSTIQENENEEDEHNQSDKTFQFKQTQDQVYKKKSTKSKTLFY